MYNLFHLIKMGILKNIERDLETLRSIQKTIPHDTTTESQKSTPNEKCKENREKGATKGNRPKTKVRGNEAGVLP